MRRAHVAVWLASAVFSAACTNNGPAPSSLDDASTSNVAVLEEAGRLRRARGTWRLTPGASIGPRAEAFLTQHRDALQIPDRVSWGPGVPVGREGRTVRFVALADGMSVRGGEILVHTVDDTVFAVTVRLPSGFDGPSEATITGEDADAAVAPHTPVEGERSLQWYSLGALWAEPEPARLHYRVVAEDEDGRPTAHYVDAETGEVTNVEALIVQERWSEIWNCSVPDSSEKACRRDPSAQRYDRGGPIGTPGAAEMAALEHATRGCQRFFDLYQDDQACDPLQILIGLRGDTAAQNEGKLYFSEARITHPTDSYTGFSHELGHALAETTARFERSGEAYAVNEGFADLNAVFADPGDDWLLTAMDVPVRDLADPAATGHVSRYSALAPNFEQHDGGLVLAHGVYRAIAGVGGRVPISETAVEQLWYELLTEWLGPNTTMRDAADAFVSACMLHAVAVLSLDHDPADHYGLTPRQCSTLANALADVDLSPQDRDGDGWHDVTDECPDTYDPEQLLVATECDAPLALEDFPESPPSVVPCPRLAAGYTLMSESGPTQRELQDPLDNSLRYHDFVVSCVYDCADCLPDGTNYLARLIYQPYEIRRYGLINTVYDTQCAEPDTNVLGLTAWSNRSHAKIEIPMAREADRPAFERWVRDTMPLLDLHAHPCP